MDRLVAARLGAYPELTAVLVDRLSARSQRLAMLQAIEALYEMSRVQGEDIEVLRGEIATRRHRARMVAAGAGSRTRMRA